MKNRWQIIVGLVVSLVTMITAVAPALAQEDKPAATEDTSTRGALAIIAPWAVPVNKEFTARVFLRNNQEPLPGAGVWAVDVDTAEKLRSELGKRKASSNQTDTERDYEGTLEKHGIFLGRTGEDGRVSHAFAQAGGYMLIASKNGHMPAFTQIRVGEGVKALGIKAPKRAPAGENVTIGVFDRLAQEPVPGAGVWAVSRDDIESLQQEAKKLKDDPDTKNEEKDYEALVKDLGKFLGRTDKDGKLTHTFKEAGIYVLVAVKRGYFPGYAPIAIVTKPKALAIKATPPQTHIGKGVTLKVTDRESNDPVEGAGVWAIARDKAADLRDALKGSDNKTDYEAAISARGDFLGRTDADGKLGATFNASGAYVLVTVKKGYLPGYTTLGVRDLPTPESNSDNKAARSADRPVKPAARPESTPVKPQSRPRVPPNTN